MAYVIADAAAEVLFVGADFYSLVEKVADEMKSVRRIIALDGGHGSWPDYATWLAGQFLHILPCRSRKSIALFRCIPAAPPATRRGHSSATPTFCHWRRAANATWGNWHENDVNLVCMPLFHIGGSGWALIGFYRGVDTVLMRDADPSDEDMNKLIDRQAEVQEKLDAVSAWDLDSGSRWRWTPSGVLRGTLK